MRLNRIRATLRHATGFALFRPGRAACALVVIIAATSAYAGCIGTESSTDGAGGEANNDASASEAQTWTVPVNVAHNVNTGSRTLEVRVLQAGELLDRGTFTTADMPPTDEVKLFAVSAGAAELSLEVYEGDSAVGFKSIRPDTCSEPDFTVHATDDQVHVWSNCD